MVIPVYQSVEYVPELLESLEAQDLPQSSFEIIAVDDGSTDGGGELLDSWCRRLPNMRVVHQPNSGWPGQPRNRGVSLSSGRYVFFADADDVLSPRALGDLTRFADRHQSDIVIPKMASLNGRWVASYVYRSTQVDAPLELVFRTLGPTKLFRRQFLLDHDIRFPVERVRLEDGMFLAKAYQLAWRVSILVDDDYYLVRSRPDRKGLTNLALDPAGYTWSVGEVARIVRELDPNAARADQIVLDLYRRKCLKVYDPHRWLNWYSEEKQRAWLTAHGQLIAEHIPEALEQRLPPEYLVRSRAVRTGNLDEVNRVCRSQSDP